MVMGIPCSGPGLVSQRTFDKAIQSRIAAERHALGRTREPETALAVPYPRHVVDRELLPAGRNLKVSVTKGDLKRFALKFVIIDADPRGSEAVQPRHHIVGGLIASVAEDQYQTGVLLEAKEPGHSAVPALQSTRISARTGLVATVGRAHAGRVAVSA